MSKQIKLFVKFVPLILFTVTSIESFAAYDLSSAIQKGAEAIVNTDMPVVDYGQINVTASRIVADLAAADDDSFSSSCGLRADCFDFWYDQVYTALTSAIQAIQALQDERGRRSRCAQARADWLNKQCDDRRITPPANDFSINFNIESGSNYDRLRPVVREFHQALWSDLSGNVWPNFIQYWSKMREVCNSYFMSIDCKLIVDHYFNQNWGSSGYAAWEQSAAAADAQSSRNGQVCRNISAAKVADSCE